MIKDFLKSLLFVFICACCVFSAHAAVSLFSDYGQIQNVQHYSSNPFWSPTAPYNQRLPQPVYATGTDLNADDCLKVVQSLVSVQCMARDNCKNTDLSDIRPTVMVQLSNLPGANYVSSCSGYIDGIFESYKQQYSNTLPNRATSFPGATVPTPSVNDSGGIQFENPYKQQPAKWQIEQKERSDELQRLQAQNGVGGEHLSKTDFPATYADLSFSARLENDRESLMPYKDATAYRTLDIKSESEWCEGEHANSPECKAYKARKGTTAQATTQAASTQQSHKQEDCSKYQQNTDRYDCCIWNTGENARANDTWSSWDEKEQKCICTKGVWGKGGIVSEEYSPSGQSYYRAGSCGPDFRKNKKYVARIRKRGPLRSDRHDGFADTDGNGCYAVCGQPVSDNLNNKALHEVMGNYYCAQTSDGLLVENNNNNAVLKMNQQQLDNIKGLIASHVADKDKCDGHAKNFIMFIGTLTESGDFTELEEVFLDD